MIAALAMLTVGVFHRPGEACGFHAFIFSGNFHDTWEALKKNPSRQVTHQDPATGRFVPADQRMAVAVELLRILRYVDTYNSAPDSPLWMHYEEGRENAIESAKAILVEMGGDAAEQVWQAVVEDIRFDLPQRRQALARARQALDGVATAQSAFQAAIAQFPVHARHIIFDSNLTPEEQEIAAILACHQAHHAGVLGMVAQARQNPQERPAQPRPLPQDFTMKAQQLRHMPTAYFNQRNVNLPDDAEVRRRWNEYHQALTAARETVTQFNVRFERQTRAMGNDMLPVEGYRASLLEILRRIGEPAKGVIERDLRSANAAVRVTAHELLAFMAKQKEAAPERSLLDLEPTYVKTARLAVMIWDLGGGQGLEKTTEAAKAWIKKGGVALAPQIMALWEKLPLPFEKECEQALELATGEKIGPSLARWQSWYRLQVQGAPPLIGKKGAPEAPPEKVLVGDGLFPPMEQSRPATPPAKEADEAWINEVEEEPTDGDRLIGRVPVEKEKEEPAATQPDEPFQEEDENVPAYERK